MITIPDLICCNNNNNGNTDVVIIIIIIMYIRSLIKKCSRRREAGGKGGQEGGRVHKKTGWGIRPQRSRCHSVGIVVEDLHENVSSPHVLQPPW